MDGDLTVRPQRGLPGGLIVPGAELEERFSRSSGPGGQSVNTTDSRVELRWDVGASRVLTDEQRQRLLTGLAARLNDAVITVAASEHRSQLLNRQAARARLANYLREAFEPPAPERRARRPSRAAKARRLEAKRRHGELKATRRRPPGD